MVNFYLILLKIIRYFDAEQELETTDKMLNSSITVKELLLL
jgi:hypothetical protein